MSATRHRLANLARRPWRDKVLVAQALALLGLSRLAVCLVPMRKLAPYFGTHMLETAQDLPLEQLREARRIAWAIKSITPYTPWKSNCYPQAITAKYLLERRGIACTLYLGATFKKEEKGGLDAHAWVRCGPMYITGGKGHEQFGTVGIFGTCTHHNYCS